LWLAWHSQFSRIALEKRNASRSRFVPGRLEAGGRERPSDSPEHFLAKIRNSCYTLSIRRIETLGLHGRPAASRGAPGEKV
jgi:hypothetical protein